MASITLSIMEEFLRSGEPHIRKNALTALSVIKYEESAKLIAQTALEDADAGVRRTAEEEINSLDESLHESVIQELTKALTGKDPQKQQRAYALLGRLRSKGVNVSEARVPWGSRMRLATSMISYVYPVRTWSLRLRGWKPGLVGTLIGSFFFVLYIFSALKPQSLRQGLWFALGLLIVLFVGILMAVLATQFTTPINLQLNRPAALLVEVLLSFLCVLFGLLILFILMGLTIPDFFYRSGSVWLILIPFYCVLAATVRVGTIMVFGQFKGKRMNRSAQVMAGTLAGFLVMSIVYFIFWVNDAFKPDLEGSVALWLSSFATAMGLANAFAKIDSEAPPE
jgi:hypothetical protein